MWILVFAVLLSRSNAQDCCSRRFQLRTLANSSFCLTRIKNSVRMDVCDMTWPSQVWMQNYTYNFVDNEDRRAFVLTNVDSGKSLRHKVNEVEEVDVACLNEIGSAFLWTTSVEIYQRSFAIRPFENTLLNLDVDHGDRGVKVDNKLILFPWHTGDNQLWEFVEV